MGQSCVRSLPEVPSTLCITWDTVCVCVCVFDIACFPQPHYVLPMFRDHRFNLWVGHAFMCQDSVRSLREAPSTLCITSVTECVCVCLPLHAHPTPTASSRCSSPNDLISGWPRLHVSLLCPILARDSIQPVYHGGHCVCVCPCLVPPLPTVYNRGHCSLI